MEMNKKLQDAINEQIKNEIYSGYMYLSMAAYFEDANLPGFAHWMKLQAKEEYEHAERFMNHLFDRGVKVILQAIDQPPIEFNSPTDIFEKTLAHEQLVTSMIENLCDIAAETKDRAASIMLQWFITEQVEEEKSASEILEILRRTKEKGSSMMMLDRKLGERKEEEDED